MEDWLLMGEFRGRLLKQWSILGAVLVLLLLLQSIFGQYNGMISFIWLWAALALLPAGGLLYGSCWLRKRPSRLFGRSLARNFIRLNTAYLVLLLLTVLLSQAAVGMNGWSTRKFFLESAWWVVPCNVFVILGMILVLYREHSRRQPSAAIIEEVARQKAHAAAEQGHPVQQQCLELVAEGQLLESLGLLQEYFAEQKTDLKEVVLLRGQYTELQRQQDLGLIEHNEAQRSLNRMAMAILNLTETI